MPKVLDPGKLYCLSPDKGSLPCFGVPRCVALVSISSWKWWKELAEQDRLGGTVVLGPSKRAWRCGYVLHMLPVGKEAVIAVVGVVVVDEACEKPDVGVPSLGGHHCGEGVPRRQGMAAVSVRRYSSFKRRPRSVALRQRDRIEPVEGRK